MSYPVSSALFGHLTVLAYVGCSGGEPATPSINKDAPPQVSQGIRQGRNLFNQGEDLKNIPAILSKSWDPEKGIRITVKNVGASTLSYDSAGPEWIQEWWMIEKNGTQTMNFDWCGTGKSRFYIRPNETADLMVGPRGGDDWALFAYFAEKDSNRSGLITLITKQEFEHLRFKHP